VFGENPKAGLRNDDPKTTELVKERTNQSIPLPPGVWTGNMGSTVKSVAQKTPFQISLCRAVGSNQQLCNNSGPNSFSVPPNRRLVIEYVSGLCPPAGTTLPVGLNVTGALLETVASGTTATVRSVHRYGSAVCHARNGQFRVGCNVNS
jgi:hypothetical protein